MSQSLQVPETIEDESPFDRELSAFMGRETFTDKMIASRKRRKNYGPNSFANELREYWFLYAFLAVSALFTLMLGVFMGLSPTVQTDGSIYFHVDGPHILMALLYGLSFVTVTEFAFGLGKRLFYMRESGNIWQAGTMLAMMTIAGASVFGTGIAGGVIVASTIDFMSEFVTVPAWAQYWVVRIIPGLIVLYSVLLTVYALSSSRAESERIIRDRQHAHDLDMEMRRKTLEQFAQEKVESAALKIYMRQIEDGTISVAQALATARSGNILDNIAAETKSKRPARPAQAAPRLTRSISDGVPDGSVGVLDEFSFRDDNVRPAQPGNAKSDYPVSLVSLAGDNEMSTDKLLPFLETRGNLPQGGNGSKPSPNGHHETGA